MSWLIPALLAALIAWQGGGRLWRQWKGSGRSAHVTASNGRRARTGTVHALHLPRWRLVLLAIVLIIAGYYLLQGDTPLPSVTCINGADASGHSWPDELGRPDPCAGRG